MAEDLLLESTKEATVISRSIAKSSLALSAIVAIGVATVPSTSRGFLVTQALMHTQTWTQRFDFAVATPPGAAAGGTISYTVGEFTGVPPTLVTVPLVTTTVAGDTPAIIATKVAATINANPTLGGLGVIATVVAGVRVLIPGILTVGIITDPNVIETHGNINCVVEGTPAAPAATTIRIWGAPGAITCVGAEIIAGSVTFTVHLIDDDDATPDDILQTLIAVPAKCTGEYNVISAVNCIDPGWLSPETISGALGSSWEGCAELAHEIAVSGPNPQSASFNLKCTETCVPPPTPTAAPVEECPPVDPGDPDPNQSDACVDCNDEEVEVPSSSWQILTALVVVLITVTGLTSRRLRTN